MSELIAFGHDMNKFERGIPISQIPQLRKWWTFSLPVLYAWTQSYDQWSNQFLHPRPAKMKNFSKHHLSNSWSEQVAFPINVGSVAQIP